MVLQRPLLFLRREKRKNRIFEGSFFDGPEVFREPDRIDLSTDCSTEKTVFNMASVVGFDLQMCGAKYLICIMIQCANQMFLPLKTKDFYKLAAAKYGVTQKSIEIAVIRAIDSLKHNSLQEINNFFGCVIFPKNATVKAGTFLNGVCGRLVMLKCHEKGKTFFG